MVAQIHGRLVVVPLGSARGGSGATQLQVVHLTVTDADGASGTGYTYSLGAGCEASYATLQQVHAPGLVGSHVLDWPMVRRRLAGATSRVGPEAGLAAISAMDIAVWDLKSRRAGLPLHRLLGTQQERLPAYGSGRATHAMTTDELVDGSLKYVQEGYRAIKLRAGVLGTDQDVARVSAVRDAVGAGVAIMVDCNERLDLASAQRMANMLAPLDILWLEEPVPAADLAGHAALAKRTPIPLAVGEHLRQLEQFTAFASTRIAAVLQPDAPLMGGVTDWMRVSTMAEAHGVSMSPHFLPELHVHLAAASRSTTWLEHFPLLDDLLGEVLMPSDGLFAPPDRDGHGIIWDPASIEHHTVASFTERAQP